MQRAVLCMFSMEGSAFRKDVNKLEKVQSRATKMIKALENMN